MSSVTSKANKRPVLSDDSSASDTEREAIPSKKSKLSSSGSSSEESDADWVVDGGGKEKRKGKKLDRKKIKKNKKSQLHVNQSSGESNKGSDSSDGEGSSESEGELAESSSEGEQPTFDDGLDDDLTKDDEDRQYLASMTEAEREQEIFKRHEQREALKARFEIEKELRMEKKMKQLENKKSQKHRTLRTKDPKQNKTMIAIDELRAKRSADKQKKAAEAVKRQEETIKREPLKVKEVFSDTSDEEDESGEEGEEGTSEEEEEEEEGMDVGNKSLSQLKSTSNRPINTIEELSKIKMSRFRLEKWVHMPYFADAVTGCFVRVGIGQHEGRMIYRICEIIKVTETSKVYTLGNTKTNKGLKLRFGVQERVFRIEYVSNSAFTEQEFTKWQKESEAHSISLPTLFEVEKKAKAIEKYKTANLKEEDIDRIIQEKQKFQKNPHNYALTKNRLIREKEIAEQTGYSDKASSIAKQLEELEERAVELDRQRTRGLSAISYINERNRQRNVTRAEEALKEEMASVKDKEEDPFTRRKCMPRLVTFGKDLTDGGEGEVTLSGSQQSSNGQTTDINQSQKGLSLEGSGGGGVNPLEATPIPPADLFSAHDFDINIDLPNDTKGPVVKATPKAMNTIRSDAPRRSLNLSDYKKRRGLI